MRKAFRHTGVLMMLAVVALGLVGAAYTLWYEKLTLVSNVTTGHLDANLSFHKWTGSGEGFDTASGSGAGKPVVAIVPEASTLLNGGASILLGMGGSGSGAGNFLYSNFPTGKPKPDCSGTLSNNNNTLTLNMKGLYPFAGCAFTINFESASGGIPFHLGIASETVTCNSGCPSQTMPGLPWTRGVVASSTSGPNAQSWSQTSDYAQCLALFNADWRSPAPPKLIKYPDQTYTDFVQVHENKPLTCTFMLILDENWRDGDAGSGYYDPAHWHSNQNLDITFTVNYVAYQWNENPAPAMLPTLP